MGKDLDEQILRRYETEVLDVHHQALPLWKRPRGMALYAVMCAYDSTTFHKGSLVQHGTSVGLGQYLIHLRDGFGQCVRWLCPGGAVPDSVPLADVTILDEAAEFIRHGANYCLLADMHIMYGRGQLAIEVDEGSRTVRLCPIAGQQPDKPWDALTEQWLRCRAVGHDRVRSAQQARDAALPAIQDLKLNATQGRIHFYDVSSLSRPEVEPLIDLANNRDSLALPYDTDLHGFNLGEYRRFWRALLAWSVCALCLHKGLISRRVPPQNCMPTQVVDRSHFLASIGQIAKLKPTTVRDIAERLSYDDRTTRPDIFLQPLVCAPDRISWSPLVVQESRYERNMLRLMSRSPSLQPVAATVIGARAKVLLGQLGSFLAKRGGYAYKLNRILRRDQETAELDLLAYSKKAPEELLVVEAKAVLDPDEINEAGSATCEMVKGQEQLRSALALLAKLPDAQKRQLYPFVDWRRHPRPYPLVVTPEAHPDIGYDHSEIPAIAFVTLKAQVHAGDVRSPSRLWLACRDKMWLQQHRGREVSYEKIKVGSVTYEIPFADGPDGGGGVCSQTESG